jgi:SAM-dependent methyltransferase/uncharacterized protein YbaR (Trm112 family)
MQSQIKLSTAIEGLLRCPICRAKFERIKDQYICTGSECHSRFPIINGIPVLLNESASLFSIQDLVSQSNTISTFQENKIQKVLRQLIPDIGQNVKGKQNYSKFAKLLLDQSTTPKVLVVGCGTLGEGMESLLVHPSIELIETDILFGPRTMLICDAHDLPFESDSLDGVIVQAVLEHVVDPHRCVEEIHRVLKKQGLVYAETPFMQQVHMGRYDFTRFTYLGHRRLFRRFEEIDSGATCGPGMALAWAYRYFLLSFTESNLVRSFIKVFASFTSFYLKYLDRYLIDKTGTLDAASSFYFIGKKSHYTLSDRELIKLYKGAF